MPAVYAQAAFVQQCTAGNSDGKIGDLKHEFR